MNSSAGSSPTVRRSPTASAWTSDRFARPCLMSGRTRWWATVWTGLSEPNGSWKMIWISLRMPRIACLLKERRSLPSYRISPPRGSVTLVMRPLASRSTNAGGINVGRYGTARNLVLGLEVVLASGAILSSLRALADTESAPVSDYLSYTNEFIVPHSTAKYAKNNRDSYMVGALARVNKDFDPSWILKSHHFRAEYAQPVVPVGYRKRIPPFRSSVAGLFLCTMAQIFPEDRGQNYAVAYGEKAAKVVLEDIAGSTS